MKKIIFLFMLLFLSASAFAHGEEVEIDYEGFLDDLDSLKTEANSYLSNAPGIVRFFIGDLNAHINFETGEGNIEVFVIIQNGLVSDISRQNIDDINLDIHFDEDAVHRILDSGNPGEDIINMVDSGEINLESRDIFTSIKLSMARRFLR